MDNYDKSSSSGCLKTSLTIFICLISFIVLLKIISIFALPFLLVYLK